MAPEIHVADAACGLTSRVAATLVDESIPGGEQRLLGSSRGHNAAEGNRVADVAIRGRIGRSGPTRRIVTVVVCRVAARLGAARHDLTGSTDGADCPGTGSGTASSR